MNQLSIYHELGMDSDPIYDKLSTLEVEKQVIIHEVVICRNRHDLYEMTHPDFHDCAKDITVCYGKLIKFLNEKLLEE